MAKKNALDWVAFVLVIIGGLNWGLVGVGLGDIVPTITLGISALAKTVYVLVGLAAVYMIYYLAKK